MLKKVKVKGYLFYAIGEILLIVVGILLALYISNRNVNQQYKSKIDNNIIRVYNELEKNIEETRKTIKELRYKDSLIHLVMNDSLKKEDYEENIDLSYLIMQNHQERLEDMAYQNLIHLNISDNRYNDELLKNLKELYSLSKTVMNYADRMGDFVSEKSIPWLAESVQSFDDLTYRRETKDDAMDYFMTSQAYKNYVSQYSIIAIRNQLDHNRIFYKEGLKVYNQISKQYNLVNKNLPKYSLAMIEKYQGDYFYEVGLDTLKIDFKNDSLFIRRRNDSGTYLVPLEEKRFFLDRTGQLKYFVSFFEDGEDWSFRIQLLSDRVVYKKLK